MHAAVRLAVSPAPPLKVWLGTPLLHPKPVSPSRPLERPPSISSRAHRADGAPTVHGFPRDRRFMNSLCHSPSFALCSSPCHRTAEIQQCRAPAGLLPPRAREGPLLLSQPHQAVLPRGSGVSMGLFPDGDGGEGRGCSQVPLPPAPSSLPSQLFPGARAGLNFFLSSSWSAGAGPPSLAPSPTRVLHSAGEAGPDLPLPTLDLAGHRSQSPGPHGSHWHLPAHPPKAGTQQTRALPWPDTPPVPHSTNASPGLVESLRLSHCFSLWPSLPNKSVFICRMGR